MDRALEEAVATAIEKHPHEVVNYRQGLANITYLAGWVMSLLRSRDPRCRTTLEQARKAVSDALRKKGSSFRLVS